MTPKSIKLYENYNAWLENKFLELGATFITMTFRDSLSLNEGLVQIYDNTSLHVGLTGNEIFQISLGDALEPINRLYGIKHSNASVDSKGDTILTFNLTPLHMLNRSRFSRVFYPDAKDSISEMIDVLYKDFPLLKPDINGIEIHVPKVPWVLDYKHYIDFSKEHGISKINDSFCFIWEDFRGINIYDHETLINRTPVDFVAGEPTTVGQFTKKLEFPLAYDIEFLTKNNAYQRNAYSNSTYHSHSFLDKSSSSIISGNGFNSVSIPRSGGYSSQQYRNGFEEYIRIHTMAQYDSYIKFTTAGNFDLTPGLKVHMYDSKNQFLSNMYIDDVVHEISNIDSYTHVYCFSSSYDQDNINTIKTIKDLEDTQSTEIFNESDINFRDEQGNINYEFSLSDNFKLKDLTTNAFFSHKLKAQNNLNLNQIVSNLQNLSNVLLEPIKSKYPNMIITSGFRAGLGNSQHLKGEAVDLQFTGTDKKEYIKIAEYIKNNLPYDQLILEFQTTGTGNPWIHVSLSKIRERKQNLTFMNNQKKHDGLVQLV